MKIVLLKPVHFKLMKLFFFHFFCQRDDRTRRMAWQEEVANVLRIARKGEIEIDSQMRFVFGGYPEVKVHLNSLLLLLLILLEDFVVLIG